MSSSGPVDAVVVVKCHAGLEARPDRCPPPRRRQPSRGASQRALASVALTRVTYASWEVVVVHPPSSIGPRLPQVVVGVDLTEIQGCIGNYRLR